MERDKLIQFIEVNQWLMTLAEISEETKESPARIKYLCEKHGYNPVRIPDRVKDSILSHHGLTFKEHAERLGMEEPALMYHCKSLGLVFDKHTKKLIVEGQPIEQHIAGAAKKASIATVYKEIADKYHVMGSVPDLSGAVYSKLGLK